MKNIFSYLIISFLFLFIPSLNATHIIGGEMGYKCLGVDPDIIGNKLYEFQLLIYRDCSVDTGFDGELGESNMHLTVYQGEEGNYQPVSFINATGIPGVVVLGGPIVEYIPVISDPCVQSPPSLCVEKGIYTFRQSLPVLNQNYYIAYQRCCRNASINNILNPEEEGVTYGIALTVAAQQLCNNSPVFDNSPEALICLDEPLSLSNTATDSDGDQLVYRFCAPLKGGSTTSVAPNPDLPPPYTALDFLAPTYTFDKPLGGNPTVSLEANTGMMSGIPNIQGQHVGSICVDEYRGGTLLSTVQRDFQFNVTNCANTVEAKLLTPTGQQEGEAIEVLSCGNTNIHIENQSQVDGTLEAYTWIFQQTGQERTITTNNKNLDIDFEEEGVYRGQLFINKGVEGCTDSIAVNVYIGADLSPEIRIVQDTCLATPIQFQNLTNINPTALATIQWNFGDGNSDTSFSTVHQYSSPGTYPVILNWVDSVGCEEKFLDTIYWYPKIEDVEMDIEAIRGCPPVEYRFSTPSLSLEDDYTIEWDFGNGTNHQGKVVNSFYDEGIYDITLTITSPIGCSHRETYTDMVIVDSVPIANFNYSFLEQDDFSSTLSFEDNSINAVEWYWNFADLDSSFFQNPIFTFSDTGRQEVVLIVNSFGGCRDTIMKTIDILPNIRIFMPNAFTPNNDGENDTFEPVGFFEGIENYQMIILDRYGKIVFQSDNPKIGWNGQLNNKGKDLSTGIYQYHISYKEFRGDIQSIKGQVTLLK